MSPQHCLRLAFLYLTLCVAGCFLEVLIGDVIDDEQILIQALENVKYEDLVQSPTIQSLPADAEQLDNINHWPESKMNRQRSDVYVQNPNLNTTDPSANTVLYSGNDPVELPSLKYNDKIELGKTDPFKRAQKTPHASGSQNVDLPPVLVKEDLRNAKNAGKVAQLGPFAYQHISKTETALDGLQLITLHKPYINGDVSVQSIIRLTNTERAPTGETPLVDRIILFDETPATPSFSALADNHQKHSYVFLPGPRAISQTINENISSKSNSVGPQPPIVPVQLSSLLNTRDSKTKYLLPPKKALLFSLKENQVQTGSKLMAPPEYTFEKGSKKWLMGTKYNSKNDQLGSTQNAPKMFDQQYGSSVKPNSANSFSRGSQMLERFYQRVKSSEGKAIILKDKNNNQYVDLPLRKIGRDKKQIHSDLSLTTGQSLINKKDQASENKIKDFVDVDPALFSTSIDSKVKNGQNQPYFNNPSKKRYGFYGFTLVPTSLPIPAMQHGLKPLSNTKHYVSAHLSSPTRKQHSIKTLSHFENIPKRTEPLPYQTQAEYFGVGVPLSSTKGARNAKLDFQEDVATKGLNPEEQFGKAKWVVTPQNRHQSLGFGEDKLKTSLRSSSRLMNKVVGKAVVHPLRYTSRENKGLLNSTKKNKKNSGVTRSDIGKHFGGMKLRSISSLIMDRWSGVQEKTRSEKKSLKSQPIQAPSFVSYKSPDVHRQENNDFPTIYHSKNNPKEWRSELNDVGVSQALRPTSSVVVGTFINRPNVSSPINFLNLFQFSDIAGSTSFTRDIVMDGNTAKKEVIYRSVENPGQSKPAIEEMIDMPHMNSGLQSEDELTTITNTNPPEHHDSTNEAISPLNNTQRLKPDLGVDEDESKTFWRPSSSSLMNKVVGKAVIHPLRYTSSETKGLSNPTKQKNKDSALTRSDNGEQSSGMRLRPMSSIGIGRWSGFQEGTRSEEMSLKFPAAAAPSSLNYRAPDVSVQESNALPTIYPSNNKPQELIKELSAVSVTQTSRPTSSDVVGTVINRFDQLPIKPKFDVSSPINFLQFSDTDRNTEKKDFRKVLVENHAHLEPAMADAHHMSLRLQKQDLTTITNTNPPEHHGSTNEAVSLQSNPQRMNTDVGVGKDKSKTSLSSRSKLFKKVVGKAVIHPLRYSSRENKGLLKTNKDSGATRSDSGEHYSATRLRPTSSLVIGRWSAVHKGMRYEEKTARIQAEPDHFSTIYRAPDIRQENTLFPTIYKSNNSPQELRNETGVDLNDVSVYQALTPRSRGVVETAINRFDKVTIVPNLNVSSPINVLNFLRFSDIAGSASFTRDVLNDGNMGKKDVNDRSVENPDQSKASMEEMIDSFSKSSGLQPEEDLSIFKLKTHSVLESQALPGDKSNLPETTLFPLSQR